MTEEMPHEDYVTAMTTKSPALIINCDCGYHRIFETNTDFNKELLSGNLPYQGELENPARGFYEKSFSYTCPDCDRTGNWAYIKDLPTTTTVVIEPHVTQNWNQRDTCQNLTESGNGYALNIYVCPECEETLSSDDHHTDGNAPEIGWEYYQCPECNKRYLPQQVVAI